MHLHHVNGESLTDLEMRVVAAVKQLPNQGGCRDTRRTHPRSPDEVFTGRKRFLVVGHPARNGLPT